MLQHIRDGGDAYQGSIVDAPGAKLARTLRKRVQGVTAGIG